jgi:hypothetical protein
MIGSSTKAIATKVRRAKSGERLEPESTDPESGRVSGVTTVVTARDELALPPNRAANARKALSPNHTESQIK